MRRRRRGRSASWSRSSDCRGWAPTAIVVASAVAAAAVSLYHGRGRDRVDAAARRHTTMRRRRHSSLPARGVAIAAGTFLFDFVHLMIGIPSRVYVVLKVSLFRLDVDTVEYQ